MKLEKVNTTSSIGDQQRHKEQSKNRSVVLKKNKKKTLVEQLNELLADKGLPFKIVETELGFHYQSLSGEVLGVVSIDELNDLKDRVRLNNSEVERGLTYEGSVPTGNFLDLDI